jgi:hypothetical protein
MRNFAISLGVVFVFAFSASAQSNPATSPSAVSPLPEFALNAPTAAAPVVLAESSAAVSSPSEALPAAPSASAALPQDVHGVYQKYSFQLYGGYTFMRFYEVPSITQTQNGFNVGGVYYYKSGIFGADGEMVATFGSALGFKSRFAFAGGGPRFRWSGPRGVELWGHGLIGGANLTPRTAFGAQGAFGYEVGGGVDISAHSRRLAYRAEADLLGTRFFNTYQYSPKVSVGIVFKF